MTSTVPRAISALISSTLLAGTSLAAESIVLAYPRALTFRAAGYCAALSTGAYAEAGFDVSIVSMRGSDVLDAVESGRAEFGVSGSEVLLARFERRPFVVVAAIQQHSPRTLALSKALGVTSFAGLRGFRLLVRPFDRDEEFRVALLECGIVDGGVTIERSDFDVSAVLSGERVALAVDLGDPLLRELQRRRILWRALRPQDVSVDFYGDCLIVREDRARDAHDRVAAFRAATLRGWRHAFDKTTETARMLLDEFGAAAEGCTAEELEAEAQTLRGALTLPRSIELGTQSRDRWARIAEAYAKLGLAPHGATSKESLDALIFEPDSPPPELPMWISRATAISAAVALAAWLWARQLKRQVKQRTKDLEARAVDLTRERENVEAVLAALAKNSELLERVFDQAADGIFVADDEGRFIDANPSGLAMLGRPREDLRRLGCDLLLGTPAESIAGGPRQPGESALFRRTLTRPDGSRIEIEIGARMLTDGRLLFIVRDLTERAELEESLRHAQKMDSVGRLAGGVAHDFNNILTAIVGCTELARERLADADPARGHLDAALVAAHQAADLTRRLLAFARKQVAVRRPVDVNRLIEDAVPILRGLVSERIETRLDLAPNLPPASADANQIMQVLVNLAANARDAMESGGTLGIATRETGESGREGRFIRVTVSDTGSGMEEGVRAHLFEPFFTTKEASKGTGLGLATCYGILEQHGGFFRVESTPGAGSSFHVHLPCATAPETPAAQPGLTVPRGSGERVLLVEDNPLVRDSTGGLLTSLGYVPIPANDALDAIAIADQDALCFDIVLTDVVMPKMSGLALIGELRRNRGDLSVVLTSGFSRDAPIESALQDGRVRFLAKPFTAAELAVAMRDSLAARATGGSRHGTD